METQLSQMDFLRLLNRILRSKLDRNPGATIELSAWLDQATSDPKERVQLKLAWIVLDTCHKKNKDVLEVSKVVLWRAKEGGPDDVEISFGSRAGAAQLRESGLM